MNDDGTYRLTTGEERPVLALSRPTSTRNRVHQRSNSEKKTQINMVSARIAMEVAPITQVTLERTCNVSGDRQTRQRIGDDPSTGHASRSTCSEDPPPTAESEMEMIVID